MIYNWCTSILMYCHFFAITNFHFLYFFFLDCWSRCEVMSFRPGWSWLPLFHSISSFLGFITVFIISKSLCHIEEWYFPYISHMGTNFPEDMLFSTFLSFEGKDKYETHFYEKPYILISILIKWFINSFFIFERIF